MSTTTLLARAEKEVAGARLLYEQGFQVADYADDFVILPGEAADILADAEGFVLFARAFCTD